MLGQVIPSGTGFCDIFLDEEHMLENLNELNKHEEEIEEDEDNLDILLQVEEDECPDDDFTFSFE